MNTKQIKSKLDKIGVKKYNPTQAGYWIGKFVTIYQDTWDMEQFDYDEEGWNKKEINKYLRWIGNGRKVKILNVDIVDETADADSAYYLFDIPFLMFNIAWSFDSNALPEEMEEKIDDYESKEFDKGWKENYPNDGW